MITRRQFLKGLAAFSVGTATFGGYSLAEPFRLNVTRYTVEPTGWPPGFRLRLAALADLHACEPWMSEERIRQIVARTNAIEPDAILLLGDYIVGNRLGRIGRPLGHEAWSRALGGLRAPLGVHAVLGNHDWWHDAAAQKARHGPVPARLALERQGFTVYENDAVRLFKDGRPFWLAGLGDQWAFWPRHRGKGRRPSQVDNMGIDDLPSTLAAIGDDAPVILMAHEPEIFPKVPARVALTLSGHTHGGQVRLLGYSPVVPSRYGQRFAYGHVVEDDRHLIVSGGLGCSGVPVRFGVPPEIVVVELGSRSGGAAT
ncbi:MAG: metallophosphoesterase [Hyphomicrobium sp.]